MKWYSFAYLSIIGAYILPGEANDTRTLIDAAVFDVPSRTFLLRAPGQSALKGSATLVNRDRKLREDSQKGLDLAMEDLARNLETEVGTFKAEVASGDRKGVDVVDSQGQSLRTTRGHNWGGAFGAAEAMAALVLVGFGLCRRRR
jgi:rhombotail lipoprotein